MGKLLEAVYENGILRPLEPLGLADHQHVFLTVNEVPNYKAWAEEQLGKLEPPPGLHAIHRLVAGMTGSMSDLIMDERGER
jgi:predicted DNA-binding antitoxin AbrB/MazE fold protein